MGGKANPIKILGIYYKLWEIPLTSTNSSTENHFARIMLDN